MKSFLFDLMLQSLDNLQIGAGKGKAIYLFQRHPTPIRHMKRLRRAFD